MAERAESSQRTRPVLWVNDTPDERVAEHGFAYTAERTMPVAVSFEALNGKWVRASFDPATGDVSVQTLKEAGRRVPVSSTHRERRSIAPTYDHVETGDRYTVESRVHGRRISVTPITDPFVSQRVTVGWWNLLRGLWHRSLEVETVVSGDREAIEDVLELNADYLGTHSSTRRQEWNAAVERGLGDLAAREAEHDVD